MTVYVKIEDKKLIPAHNGYNGIIGFAEDYELMNKNGFVPYSEELISKYFSGMAIIKDNKIVDISESEEYKDKILFEQNILKKNELQSKLNELDMKSIRAMRELEIKDTETGQTWLEYYTLQIQDLRMQIAGI